MDKYSEVVVDEGVESNGENNTEGSEPPPRQGRRVMWFSLALVGTIAGALAAVKVYHETKPQTNPADFQQLFDAEVGDQPVQATKFITSRSLAQVGAYSFDMKCPPDQPICNPEVVFASKMQESLDQLKKVAPDIYEELDKNTLTKEQQELILRVSLLVKNKEVLEEGRVVAETVKHWSKSGSKVVHEKVKDALMKFSNEHGNEQTPKMSFAQPDMGNSSIWEVLMEPHLLSHIAGSDTDATDSVERQLKQYEDPDRVYGGDFFGGFFGFMFPYIFLIFEVLHYNNILLMRKMLRVVFMWFQGVTGSIICLAIAPCPMVFLSYWFNAWLLFANKPSEMKGIPWDFMLKQLPGLNHKDRRLLIAADPLIAA